MDEAQYVVVLAASTGWTEDHIRHQLPLSRGYAYYHAARILAGERCRWPGKKTAATRWVAALKSWARDAFRR